ncbi:MAG: hypothetical protein ABIP96_02575 [Patescibacteria group bacterium]
MYASARRLALRALALLAPSPLYVTYGLFVLLRAMYRTTSLVVRSLSIFRTSIRCAQGHEVPVVGRFHCGSCKTDYLGSLIRCRTCGEGAELTTCPVCRTGVRLPWEGR